MAEIEITEAKLSEWQKLADEACPGPRASTEQERADDLFRCAAYTAVPALIAEVRRLREELQEARK